MQNQPSEDLYKVRATDNLVYGPVTLPVLLEWAKAERVLADTLIHSQSGDTWQKAEAIPALRQLLSDLNQTPGRPAHGSDEICADELRQFPQLARLTDRQSQQVRATKLALPPIAADLRSVSTFSVTSAAAPLARCTLPSAAR